MAKVASVLWDIHHMDIALGLARRAVQLGQRPFGCVIANADNLTIGEGLGSERDTDPICHSEIIAIRMACMATGGLLHGCTLYSTHEPCTMCCGAILHAKVARVVWGSSRVELQPLFRRQRLSAWDLLLGQSSTPPVCRAGVLRDRCLGLFSDELAAVMADA